MDLSDLEKQLQEIQQINASTLTPEQLQELVDKLSSIMGMGEEILSNSIKEFENEELIDNNESYDENNS